MTRVNDPPNDMLCRPRVQFTVSSMFQFGVFRSSAVLPPPVVAPVAPSGNPRLNPCWFANCSAAIPCEKRLGDHCQPPVTRFTRLGDSVDRKLIEPTVRCDL